MEGKNKNKCLFVILEMEYCCKIESKMSLVRYFETMKTQLFHEAEKKSIFPEIQFQFNSRQIYGLKQKKFLLELRRNSILDSKKLRQIFSCILVLHHSA